MGEARDVLVLPQDKGWPDTNGGHDGSSDAQSDGPGKYRLLVTLVQFSLFNGKPFRAAVTEAGTSAPVAQMEVRSLMASPDVTLSYENAVDVGKMYVLDMFSDQNSNGSCDAGDAARRREFVVNPVPPRVVSIMQDRNSNTRMCP